MAILTHGTTLEGFKAIMAGNGKADLPAPWTVSDNDGAMYFYDAAAVAGDYGCDEFDASYARNASYENATLQVAMTAKSGLVVVLTCDIPDDILEVDYSCDNMEHARSIGCDEFKLEYITAIHICEIDQWSIPFLIQGVIDNPMFNVGELPPKLLKLATVCGYDDDHFDYELIEVEKEKFIRDNA